MQVILNENGDEIGTSQIVNGKLILQMHISESKKLSIKEQLEALFIARNVAEDFRLRVLIGKGIEIVDSGNVYNEKLEPERLDELINTVIDEEFIRSKILYITKEEPLSVEEMAKKLKIPSEIVLEHIVTLKDRDLVQMERIEDYSPLYLAKHIEVDEASEPELSTEVGGGD